METECKKHVGIWIRVSTDDQARGESPEHHEYRARSYADAKDWKVVELYDLSGVSGKTVVEHPEAKRMLADIKRGHIDALIFSKLARLARNTRELLDISDYFREYDADLVSLHEVIDTTSPAGRLFYTMISAMAQWEREEISERVAASVPVRAQLGKSTGGAAPFGYQWKDKLLVPHPEEAHIRKLMFELFLEHRRKKTVARLLNEQGHRTRNNGKFTGTTVDRLLKDPVAKGLRRANYTKSTGNKKHWVKKPESEWVYTQVEPIVSEELWNKCNAILDEQHKKRTPPSRRAVHLFGGLVHCQCGGKMNVPSNSPKYTCKECRSKILVEDLETIFHEQLKSFLFSPEEIVSYFQKADDKLKEQTDLLASLEQKRSDIQREMDKLYDLYMSDEISKDGFGRSYRPLEERFNQLNNQIPELQGEIDFLKIEFLSSEEIVSDAKDLYNRWPTLAQEEKLQIVEMVTEKILVEKDEVSIHLHYLPSLKDSGNRAMKQQGFIAAIS